MSENLKNVGFTDYDVERAEIARRQKLAQLMQQGALTPFGPTEQVGGFAVRRSPMEGIGRMAQAGAGAYMESKADERAKALAERIRGDRQTDYGTLMTGMQGQPAQPAEVMPEEVAGPPRPAQAAVAPGQINPAIIAQLRTPEAQAMAQKMWYEQNKPVSPDARLRYQGEMERHGTPSAGAILSNQGAMTRHETPSGSAILSNQGAMERHLAPSGSAQLGAQTAVRGQDIGAATSARGQDITMRGQNMTDARQREATAVAARTAALKQQELENKLKQQGIANSGALASYQTAVDTLGRLDKHPGFAEAVGAGWEKTGIPFVGPIIPGTDRANFVAELDAFKAQTFLPMVQNLRGMGALSDTEGKKLADAVGALITDMGEKAFKESVRRIAVDLEAAGKRITGKSSVTIPQNIAPSGAPRIVDW